MADDKDVIEVSKVYANIRQRLFQERKETDSIIIKKNFADCHIKLYRRLIEQDGNDVYMQIVHDIPYTEDGHGGIVMLEFASKEMPKWKIYYPKNN